MKHKAHRPAHEIAVKGFEAVVEKFGPGGALQFIHHCETGPGDYTQERRVILKGATLKKLRAELLPKQ